MQITLIFQIEESLVLTESKLEQKNAENDSLQDSLQQATTREAKDGRRRGGGGEEREGGEEGRGKEGGGTEREGTEKGRVEEIRTISVHTPVL